MKKLQKTLTISVITAGLLLGSSIAMAETQKVWTDKGPIIKVHPASDDLAIQANISYEKENTKDETQTTNTNDSLYNIFKQNYEYNNNLIYTKPYPKNERKKNK